MPAWSSVEEAGGEEPSPQPSPAGPFSGVGDEGAGWRPAMNPGLGSEVQGGAWNRVSPRSVHASTVKKSAAAIACQWARRKVLHGKCRCGAGPRPCSFRMRRTVDRLTRCPRLAGAGVIAMRENPPESVRDPCAACGAWRKARGPFRFRRRRARPFLARGRRDGTWSSGAARASLGGDSRWRGRSARRRSCSCDGVDKPCVGPWLTERRLR